MKTRIFTIFFLFAPLISPVLAQTQSGTTLTAGVTCVPSYTRIYNWTIAKSVTPSVWNLFRGDQGTSQFTITVTKGNYDDMSIISGEISVTNGGAVATQGLAIRVELRDGIPPPNDLITTIGVDVSANPILDPGETGTYVYGGGIENHPGGTYKVTANVTITNHSGSSGTPYGPSPSCSSDMPLVPTLVNSVVNVIDDTRVGSWSFNQSGSVSYSKTFTADVDAGTHTNTTTITETHQSASATVTVNCYTLGVTKDASTSLKRTYDWTINKSADQSSLTLAAEETFVVNYTVTVDATHTDSDWKVAGSITVHNPAPIDAVIKTLSDVVSGVGVVTYDCGSISFPYTLAAGSDLSCTYSMPLPDASSRTNTATATLQNYSASYDGTRAASGTTDFSGTTAVGFAAATITEVDKCADVGDTYTGTLGTVCAGVDNLPKNFTYSRTVGPFSGGGSYPVNNTATSTTQDKSVSSQATWDIAVTIPVSGCTLTPGYWKTHSHQGPAPYDDEWKNLGPLEEATVFFLSGHTYYEVLRTEPKGNAYYILAHAYIAAQLNFLKGADPTAAQEAFNSATALFNTYTPASIAGVPGNNSIRKQFTASATTLDKYNNGIIGPGHCSEQSEAGSDSPGSTDEPALEKPSGYRLHQNFPNPFNPVTQIRFAVQTSGHASVVVYNTIGEIVATLFDGNAEAGRYYQVEFDAGNLSTGVYFYRLSAGDMVQTRKLMIVR